MDGRKNLSLPDLLSRSLTTTRQDEHRLRTVEIPDSIKIFMTHNQNTQIIECHYAVSKEYINTVSTENTRISILSNLPTDQRQLFQSTSRK